jgi:hypothetical protein
LVVAAPYVPVGLVFTKAILKMSAVKVTDEAAPVVAADSVTAVPLTIAAITVPAATLVPLTAIPTESPAVEARPVILTVDEAVALTPDCVASVLCAAWKHSDLKLLQSALVVEPMNKLL